MRTTKPFAQSIDINIYNGGDVKGFTIVPVDAFIPEVGKVVEFKILAVERLVTDRGEG